MTDRPLFTGCAAAMITPFLKDGALDEAALRKLVRLQREAGMDAVVLLGTTGEPCSLSEREREDIIRIGLEEAGGMPVIVGTGSSDTETAIRHARQAHALGAAGQLVVTPYYNKATQTGMLRHFEAIAEASPLPMILYHVPSRTGATLEPETIARLAEHPFAAGIKEASGNLLLTAEILEKTGGSFPVYCGSDELILPLMAEGAVGAISVVANVAPLQTRAITAACLAGCMAQARSAQAALQPLIRALFSQVSPIPAKAALSMLGLCEDRLRLPLTPMEEPYRGKLEALLRGMRLIS